MKNLEIEKKYLVKLSNLPKNLRKYKNVCIEQGFICFKPCIRVRKAGNKYYLTIKGKPPKSYLKYNDLVRTEFEIEIDKKVYNELLKKCDGIILKKRRYYIPYKKYIIELDIFENEYKGLVYAEVEFKSINEANKFVAPDWFYKDVTSIEKYKNTSLSKKLQSFK